MVGLLFFLLRLLVSPFRPISGLEAENAALRRQLIVLQRQVRGRVQFTNSDRLLFLQLYRWFPSIVQAMTTVRPETLVRWHRAGFRRYWRWKSRNLGGRPRLRRHEPGGLALVLAMNDQNGGGGCFGFGANARAVSRCGRFTFDIPSWRAYSWSPAFLY